MQWYMSLINYIHFCVPLHIIWCKFIACFRCSHKIVAAAVNRCLIKCMWCKPIGVFRQSRYFNEHSIKNVKYVMWMCVCDVNTRQFSTFLDLYLFLFFFCLHIFIGMHTRCYRMIRGTYCVVQLFSYFVQLLAITAIIFSLLHGLPSLYFRLL